MSKTRRHLEDDLQAQCIKWFRLQYPDLVIFHIPNGGKRNKFEAIRLKKQGVLAGVADLFLAKASKGYHGFFMELKVGDNKLTDNQAIFEKQIIGQGYKFAVITSLYDFIFWVNDYVRNEN